MAGDFRELKIWQKAFSLDLEVRKLTQTYPKVEKYGLTDQTNETPRLKAVVRIRRTASPRLTWLRRVFFSSLLLPAGRQVTHWQSQWCSQVRK